MKILALASGVTIFLVANKISWYFISFYIEVFFQDSVEQILFIDLFFDLLALFAAAPISLYVGYQTYTLVKHQSLPFRFYNPAYHQHRIEATFDPQQFLRLYVCYLCYTLPLNFGLVVTRALFGEEPSLDKLADKFVFLIVGWLVSLTCSAVVYRCTRRWVKDGGRSASYRKVRDGILVFCASYISLLTLLYFTTDSSVLGDMLGDLIVPYLGLMSDFMQELLSHGETWFWLVSACVRLVCAMFGLLCVAIFSRFLPIRASVQPVASET